MSRQHIVANKYHYGMPSFTVRNKLLHLSTIILSRAVTDSYILMQMFALHDTIFIINLLYMVCVILYTISCLKIS